MKTGKVKMMKVSLKKYKQKNISKLIKKMNLFTQSS